MTGGRPDLEGACGRLSRLPTALAFGRFRLVLDRPLVMGIVNVTPDSFSDGGRHADADAAVAAGLRLVAEGADILDIGGESTRPGAAPVSADAEWQRVAPVIAGLAAAGVPLSIDTRRPAVMARAIAAGIDVVNDVEGFGDPAAVAALAASQAGAIVMHMQGRPQTMQADPVYADVVTDVGRFLAERTRRLVEQGVAADRIVVDPGFGFGKTLDHNLALLRALDRFGSGGHPVLAGVSRKSMIGALTGRPVGERLAGSLAAAIACVAHGAAIVRVHDVAETVDALAVWRAVQVPRVAGAGR